MVRRSSTVHLVLFFAFAFSTALPAFAQTPPAAADPAAGAAPAQSSTPADDPAALDVMEPDFSLINLPTTLRLPTRG